MRPTVPDDLADRVADVVDEEAAVPASHLTFAQQIRFLADRVETYRAREEAEEDSSQSPATAFNSQPGRGNNGWK
jgi:hypothetical protein